MGECVNGASTPASGRGRQPLGGGGLEGAALREPGHLSHLGPSRVPALLPHARRLPSYEPFYQVNDTLAHAGYAQTCRFVVYTPAFTPICQAVLQQFQCLSGYADH